MPRMKKSATRKSRRRCPIPAAVLKELRVLRLEVAQLPRFNKKWECTHNVLLGILKTRYCFGRVLTMARKTA